jgi:hypothetical protein
LGNFTVNRYSGLLLAPGRIRITYVVDMAEIPTFQERGATDTDGDGVVSEAERGVWAGEQARDVMANLSLTVDGRPVPLSIQGRSMTLRPGQGGASHAVLQSDLGRSAAGVGEPALRRSQRRRPDRVEGDHRNVDGWGGGRGL